MPPSLSSHINFVKAHDFTASISKNKTQTFKAKRSNVSNNKGRSYKTQPPLTQRGKAQTRAPRHRHAYMYSRYNHNRHATQHNSYILLNPNLCWPRLVSLKIIHGEHVHVQFSVEANIASMSFGHAIETFNICKLVYPRMKCLPRMWNMPFVLLWGMLSITFLRYRM